MVDISSSGVDESNCERHVLYATRQWRRLLLACLISVTLHDLASTGSLTFSCNTSGSSRLAKLSPVRSGMEDHGSPFPRSRPRTDECHATRNATTAATIVTTTAATAAITATAIPSTVPLLSLSLLVRLSIAMLTVGKSVLL